MELTGAAFQVSASKLGWILRSFISRRWFCLSNTVNFFRRNVLNSSPGVKFGVDHIVCYSNTKRVVMITPSRQQLNSTNFLEHTIYNNYLSARITKITINSPIKSSPREKEREKAILSFLCYRRRARRRDAKRMRRGDGGGLIFRRGGRRRAVTPRSSSRTVERRTSSVVLSGYGDYFRT